MGSTKITVHDGLTNQLKESKIQVIKYRKRNVTNNHMKGEKLISRKKM